MWDQSISQETTLIHSYHLPTPTVFLYESYSKVFYSSVSITFFQGGGKLIKRFLSLSLFSISSFKNLKSQINRWAQSSLCFFITRNYFDPFLPPTNTNCISLRELFKGILQQCFNYFLSRWW